MLSEKTLSEKVEAIANEAEANKRRADPTCIQKRQFRQRWPSEVAVKIVDVSRSYQVQATTDSGVEVHLDLSAGPAGFSLQAAVKDLQKCRS